MKSGNSQVSAYVLHTKSYQENSQIIQLFSLECGRFSVIAKGIKGKRSQARKAQLQPFIELKVEFTGKGELKTLIGCEMIFDHFNPTSNKVSIFNLQGNSLAFGYYANELILRACPEQHEYPELFVHYRNFLNALRKLSLVNVPVHPILRNFEVALLTDIGLAPDWLYDIEQNEIEADKFYYLLPEQGFKLVQTDGTCEEPGAQYQYRQQKNGYRGQSILSLASGEYLPQDYKSSQQIMAFFLAEIIGNKPLQSRKLWQHLNLSQATDRNNQGT